MDFATPDIAVIQAGWVLLILASPALCWLCGRAVGVDGNRALLAVVASIALTLAAVSPRADEPLHANGHAWREAREALMPSVARGNGLAPFLHGKGGISLQWLVAGVERRIWGTADPFRISRVAGAAAAGGAALLTIVLVGSVWAGVAAGAVAALMPFARVLAVSGSALAIPGWILPWSLALWLSAGMSGSRLLLAGAMLSAALGILSHTAMLAWPAGLLMAWVVIARREVRVSAAIVVALLGIGLAWCAELHNAYEMLQERNQTGLLDAAWRGFQTDDLFRDPSWMSPALSVLLVCWVVFSLRPRRWSTMVASVVPAAVVAVPFFAVTACSSDAVRYQGALVALAASLAVAGLWQASSFAWLGTAGSALLRLAGLIALVAFPLPSARQPLDPVAAEHRLVIDAAARIPPGMVVVLPVGRWDGGTVLTDFPDFVLPEGAQVVFEDDFRLRQYRGPRLLYLGLACVSWGSDGSGAPQPEPSGMRPECTALRGSARPWMVRAIDAADIPHSPDGRPWTFHRISLGEPFGFFEP